MGPCFLCNTTSGCLLFWEIMSLKAMLNNIHSDATYRWKHLTAWKIVVCIYLVEMWRKGSDMIEKTLLSVLAENTCFSLLDAFHHRLHPSLSLRTILLTFESTVLTKHMVIAQFNIYSVELIAK